MSKIFFFFLLFNFLEITFSTYKTLDGSQLIPLSYTPNSDYDATEVVSQENVNQEMLSYYSWFASYGYCQEVDIPLLCCKNYLNFFHWEMDYYHWDFYWIIL